MFGKSNSPKAQTSVDKGEGYAFANVDTRTRNITMAGLAFAMLVACFDGTIVGTCAPVIVEELQGMELYAWMTTAFMLCETITIPIAGKMSDRFGRKPLFLTGLTIFTVGSILAGLSVNMEMMILCRAIQGLGGGILIPVAMASVGDFYPEEERGKIQGALGAVFGIGSAAGPLIGGYIAESMSWHWCFYISVPLAAVAYALTIKQFPVLNVDPNSLKKIDYAGICTLIVFLLDLLLLLQFGGDKIEWISMESFAMIAIAIALLAVFVFIESKAEDPVIALKLFKNRTVVAAMIFMALFGIGMMGAMTYSSMFNIYVFGLSTLKAGEVSLAMVAGIMITSLSSGALLNRTGYKLWLISGPIITFIALYWMSGIHYGSELIDMIIGLFVLGLGLGCMSSVVMVAVQNNSEPDEMGMTTSSVNLLRSIGSTSGTAIFAMLISSKISNELTKHVLDAGVPMIPGTPFEMGTGVMNFISIYKNGFGPLPPQHELYEAVMVSFANSVDFAFITGGLIILILVIVGLFIKGNRIQNRVMAEEIHINAKENEEE